MTFVAALRHDRIDAPWVIDGPINGELFSAYVEKVLVPTPRPGRHCPARQSGQPQGQAGARGHSSRWRAPLVPASLQPDLNPIEQVFAKLTT
jgi:transposase